MKKKIFDFRFSIFNWFGLACFLFIGCAVPRYQEPQLCPGKGTAVEVVAALRAEQTSALSLVGAVDCRLEFIDPEGKSKNETFGGKLFFVSPENLCIAGEKFGPIRIGVNPDEFWLYFKPAVDTAWYGQRKDTFNCGDKSGFNPASMVYLTEAFGQIDLNANWTLTNDPGYDVLETAAAEGIKRVFVNCCTGRIERIEYCRLSGNLVMLAASADLADYQTVDGVGEIPTIIQLRHFRLGQSDMMFQLKLSAMKKFTPTALQQEKLFVRPGTKGYKKIYRLNELCDFIRE